MRAARPVALAQALPRYLLGTTVLALIGLWTAGFARAGGEPLVPLPARPRVLPHRACQSLLAQEFTPIEGAPMHLRTASDRPAGPDGPDACIVEGYVSPQVRFRLVLPSTRYTDRYLQGGCGGLCGVISEHLSPACDSELASEGSFATAFTDSGHQGDPGEGAWAAVDPTLRTDYAYRGAHVTALAARAVIAAFYGHPPRYRYFQGCSDGGRSALQEAQRYPNDFQGIVAGSAPVSFSALNLRFVWEAQIGTAPDGIPIITPEAAELLHHAALMACDALDGAQDGQIDDPRLCHFDPGTLLCAEGLAQSSCLSAAQVQVARQLYEGPRDAEGNHLYLGGEPYGSELNWAGPHSLAQAGTSLALEFVRYLLYPDRDPQTIAWRTMRLDDSALRQALERGAPYDPKDPDLRPFRRAGGRMILWQGTADNAAGEYSTLDYYRSVRRAVGGMQAARQFMRVFMIPAVYHCDGGYIPYQADVLGTIVRWVETGDAPNQLMAVATLGDGARRRRPVFAYPVHAKYVGGDLNAAASFTAETPAHDPDDTFVWVGAESATRPLDASAASPDTRGAMQ